MLGVTKMNINVGESDTLVSTPIVFQSEKKEQKVYRGIKRMIDIMGGLVGTILLLPITIILYLANLLVKDKGPVFYTHERIGKNGKKFKLYKYRSMVVGADEILANYLAVNEEARKEYKKYKKLQNQKINKI